MTTPEIVHNLKTNPFFAMEIVVDNNPAQVSINMERIYGQVKEQSIDQLKDLIYEIFDNGSKIDKANVINALKVRWIPEHASPSLNAAYNIVFAEAEYIKNVRNNKPSIVKRSILPKANTNNISLKSSNNDLCWDADFVSPQGVKGRYVKCNLAELTT
jgi:hypothetical protein